MIRCEALTKRYAKTLALDGLDLEIADGELHGLIGPNGAGKTTAIKILSTLLRPTGGDAFVDGLSVTREPQKVRMLVGYMPDFFGVYDNLKAWEYLDLYAGCVNMDDRTRRKRIDELLELTMLTKKREAYVDSLSRGMKQRLCLARALMHNPKLLILDEPASGMDPRARTEMREILKEVGRMGKTVLISSHILPELSELCSSVTILEKGKAVFSGSVDALEKRMHRAPLVIRFVSAVEEEKIQQAKAQLLKLYDAEIHEDRPLEWSIHGEENNRADAEAISMLVRLGLPVCSAGREHASLEQVFMEVTRREAESDL